MAAASMVIEPQDDDAPGVAVRGPEPSRYIIILPARLDELISALHEADPAEHAAIYRRYESELLE
jgi:hypothetical protein